MKTAFRLSPACMYLQHCTVDKALSQVLCLSFPTGRTSTETNVDVDSYYVRAGQFWDRIHRMV